jgi:hypothetical protein
MAQPWNSPTPVISLGEVKCMCGAWGATRPLVR